MQQKFVGASVSVLIVSFLCYHCHLLPVSPSNYRRDTFYMEDAAALNFLVNDIDETCLVWSVLCQHHTFGDEPWEETLSTPQGLWKLDSFNIDVFRSISISRVRGVPGVYPNVHQQSQQIQHKEQKRKQHPFEDSHTSLPRYPHNENDNDNEKLNKHLPESHGVATLHFPPETGHIHHPIYASYWQHQREQPSLNKSNDGISSSIYPTSPNAVPSRLLIQKDITRLNLLPFLVRGAERQTPHLKHTYPLSSTVDNSSGSQISFSLPSSSPSSSSSATSSPSSSYPICATRSRISSCEKEIRGSLLGIVVCIVVSVLWI
ncbi:hypothetical protein I7I48_11973 [Histoplasma ohiense]|nr:hypothetical protein I7I48_11973 [Histoplasma ohiense (nom. inval.)]